MTRALTGIKPTNLLHIGNYFGALLPAIQMQHDFALTMMVADLHAITVPQKPEELSKNISFIVATYLAAGIDPQKTLLFQQSQVPAHAELAWLLQCVARMGEVERMTQYKDKAKVKGEQVSVGLFTYPVLMAADILLYQSDVVPVGHDQKQHVELARDLAERFNRDFGDTFVIPKPVIRKEGAKILGLDDPAKKMSKSAPTPKNYISLLDNADTISKKMMSAVTDSFPGITYDETRPGVANILTILALATQKSVEDIAGAYEHKGMKELKEDTAEALIALLTPLQKKIVDLTQHPDHLLTVLQDGNARAQNIASLQVARAQSAMGLILKA